MVGGRLKTRVVLIASLVVVGAAVAVPTTIWLNGDAWPGRMIVHPDYSSVTIYVREPLVGDVVMFLADMPGIASGKSIKVLSVTLSKGTPGLRFVGGRIYERKDFGGSALLTWQSKNGDRNDPHLRPSTDLVGAVLEGAGTPERFIMFEFMVCAPGDLSADAIVVTYKHGSTRYRQTLKVRYEVRGALPGVSCT